MVSGVSWNSGVIAGPPLTRTVPFGGKPAIAKPTGGTAPTKATASENPLASLSRHAEEAIDWCSGVLKGDFEENPTIGQTVARSLLTMIPFVDQGGDIQDLTANLYKCYKKGKIESADGVAIALTAVGAIPELGSALKGSFKIMLQASKELASNKAGDAVALARKMFALPMVRKSIERFLAEAQALKKDMIAGINAALDQISRLNPDLAAYVAAKRTSLIKAASDGFDALRENLANTRNRLVAPPPRAVAAPTTPNAPKPIQPSKAPLAEPQKYFSKGNLPAVRQYSWGKAVSIDAFPAGMSIKDRALFIRDAMNAAGVEQVVLPKGGDKGQIMAVLQQMEDREFLYLRSVNGAQAGERVLVRGDAHSVAFPSLDMVPIAHTHPESSLEKFFGDFISVMPSEKDIEVLRETAGYSSSMIISVKGQARRHIDFRQVLDNPLMKKSLSKLSASGRESMYRHAVEQRLGYEEVIHQLGLATDRMGPRHKRYGEFLRAMTDYNRLAKDCAAMESLLHTLPKATH